jgi:hypothetical protein
MCGEFQDHGETVSLIHVFSRARGISLPTKIDRFSVVSAFDGEPGEEFDYRANFQAPNGKSHGPAMDIMHCSFRRVPEIVSADFADYVFFEHGTYTIEIELNGNPIYVAELRITN